MTDTTGNPAMPAGTRVSDEDGRTGVVIPCDDVRFKLPESVLVRLDTKLHGHWNYWYRPERLAALAPDGPDQGGA